MRVSITDGLNALFAAPALLQFSEQYPKIQLHLKSPLNIMNLRENQTDMMISIVPTASSDIQFRRLGQLHFIPIARKTISGKHGLPTRNNLEQHLFIQSEYYLAKPDYGTAGSRPWRADALRITATIPLRTACW